MSVASHRRRQAAYAVPPPRAMPATDPTPTPSSAPRVPVRLRPVAPRRKHLRIPRQTSSHIVLLESAKWNIIEPLIEMECFHRIQRDRRQLLLSQSLQPEHQDLLQQQRERSQEHPSLPFLPYAVLKNHFEMVPLSFPCCRPSLDPDSVRALQPFALTHRSHTYTFEVRRGKIAAFNSEIS
ncbi:hypothetical protein ALC56_04500 [Trachymyrmex septentrionalis]|uniref:Uncharacterized protein n=1 Tax=Trachymyrmex septentrionalis TaxID=34720 RepID=A0A195FLQ3_9HYME|nr:hypothetical protein ALC56_04500 [Trachymyrmex septentrionalis]